MLAIIGALGYFPIKNGYAQVWNKYGSLLMSINSYKKDYTMAFHVKCFSMVIFSVIALQVSFAAEKSIYRFDMGTPDSPLKEGYVKITPEDVYSPSKGYGWKTKPATAFDRPKSRCKARWYQNFWGTQIVGSEEYYGEQVDDLWRDGVADKKDTFFKVNLPGGVYEVFVTVGDEEWTRLDMNIAAEKQALNITVKVVTMKRSRYGRLLIRKKRMSSKAYCMAG